MALRTAVPRRTPVNRYGTTPQRVAVASGPKGAQPPAQQPPATGVQPGAAAGADYSGDPILAQIRALYGPGGTYLTNAQGTYDERRKAELINYGYDPSLDSLYPDEQTKAAAKANPYSTLATLGKNNTIREKNINEGENKANLWFSGHHGVVLGQNADTFGRENYAAGQGLKGVLGQLSDTLAGAQNYAGDQLVTGTTAASDRSTNFALQYGLGDSSTPTPASTAPRAAVVSPNLAARTAIRKRLRGMIE
jgi:hypothetical protein